MRGFRETLREKVAEIKVDFKETTNTLEDWVHNFGIVLDGIKEFYEEKPAGLIEKYDQYLTGCRGIQKAPESEDEKREFLDARNLALQSYAYRVVLNNLIVDGWKTDETRDLIRANDSLSHVVKTSTAVLKGFGKALQVIEANDKTYMAMLKGYAGMAAATTGQTR